MVSQSEWAELVADALRVLKRGALDEWARKTAQMIVRTDHTFARSLDAYVNAQLVTGRYRERNAGAVSVALTRAIGRSKRLLLS